MQNSIINLFILSNLYQFGIGNIENSNEAACSIKSQLKCSAKGTAGSKTNSGGPTSGLYNEGSNHILQKIQSALSEYTPCAADENDRNCDCHASVISDDLELFRKSGITKAMIRSAGKFGTRYKILNKKLYREEQCMFPARCTGIEHFMRLTLNNVKDMDLVVNTRDWPQRQNGFSEKLPVFSFSKTKDYMDIMYPAWSFWAGGPAISLYPTGIGRWDILRNNIKRSANNTLWREKEPIGFFRGSRTSSERDNLVLLSRRRPELVDAKYTKNQAWKSLDDTLNAEPAKEVSFEDHCHYKYLFNFRGVAASFRHKHLFLCKSLVFHVGDEWQEFYYRAMKPWVHYVPLPSSPSEEDIEKILTFFQNHDGIAQQIAERGFEFTWNHLRVQDVECYWVRLLTEYQKLLKYKVQKDVDLTEI